MSIKGRWYRDSLSGYLIVSRRIGFKIRLHEWFVGISFNCIDLIFQVGPLCLVILIAELPGEARDG